MAIKDKIAEEFLLGLKEIEPALLEMQFEPHSFYENGLAYYIQYRNEANGTIVEFLFGPSDWETEIIIYTSKDEFGFKDLLEIPAIAKWVDENRYTQGNERNIKKELHWDVELLRICLPIIEQIPSKSDQI